MRRSTLYAFSRIASTLPSWLLLAGFGGGAGGGELQDFITWLSDTYSNDADAEFVRPLRRVLFAVPHGCVVTCVFASSCRQLAGLSLLVVHNALGTDNPFNTKMPASASALLSSSAAASPAANTVAMLTAAGGRGLQSGPVSKPTIRFK